MMSIFFDMGGYAGFVWPAYAITLILLFGLGWKSMASARESSKELARLQAQSPHRRRQSPPPEETDYGL